MQLLFRISIICFCILLPFSATSNISKFKKNELKPKFLKSGVSRLNLVGINYFNNKNLNLSKKNDFTSNDSLKILGIRVQFPQDTLATTTGDGRFILSLSDTTIIDPPPHDREYFQAQLETISHYYRSASNDKLILSGDIYPVQNEQSYTLSHTMDYYNPNSSDELVNQRLAELFQETIQLADNQDNINFSQYDIFVIFHAGVGQDFANEFDTTPNDIPSIFLNYDQLKKYLGENDPAYPGIQTSSGFIREGIILPETENQEGSEFALKGIFVLYLGNQLGLPSLFDTDKGNSGIGAWGLMDVGSSNYFGLIPAQPCAWTKLFMGWVDPVILSPGTNIQIAVGKSKSQPHIYKIPINSREYFLIENRNRDFNQDKITTGTDQFGHRLEFNPFGNFTAQIDTTGGERLGVITKIFDYDFSIPGDGILIWHIDDRVIEENYYSNTINVDQNHPGVDLEEADGSQDIGQNYGFLSPGSGSEFGVADDAFFFDNEIHKIANNSDFVSFFSNSAPASKSYSDANTGIVINNFSMIDSVMWFDFRNDLKIGNFPRRFAGDIQINFPPVIAPRSPSENNIFFFTPGNNQLFAWKSNGTPLIDNDQEIIIDTWQGDSLTFQTALFDTVNGFFSNPPIIGDINGDGINEILGSIDFQTILIWSFEQDPDTRFGQRIGELNVAHSNMLFWGQNLIITDNEVIKAVTTDQQIWELDTGSRIENICLTRNNSGEHLIAAFLQNKNILLIDQNGQLVNQVDLSFILPDTGINSLISGFVDSKTEPALILISKKQTLALSNNLDILDGFPVYIDEPIKLQPIIIDLDQDGFGEVIIVSQKKVYAFNHNGVISSGFPVDLKTNYATDLYLPGSPLAIVSQNSGYIFVKDGSNDIMLIDHQGQSVRDFTLNGGGSSASPFLSLADINQDGFIEIADPNSDGLFNVRRLEISGLQVDGSWLQTNFDHTGSRFNSIPTVISPVIGNKLLSYAFNYPNPTQNNKTTFRFFISNDADVTVDIYDLAGENIAELKSRGTGNVENELVWFLEDIASGVYMARIEVSDGNNGAYKIIKVAVVK